MRKSPSLALMGKAALFASCALLLAHIQASAATIGVDLGAAGFQTGATIPPDEFNNAGIFAIGDGGGDIVKMSDNAIVSGDVAVQGTGNTKLEKSAKILGRLAYKSTGTLSQAPGTSISGPIYHNVNGLLTAGTDAATAAASTASGFAATDPRTKIDTKVSLTLGTGVFSSQAVYNLTDLKLDGNIQLTLQGTSDAAYVFNVSKNFDLSNGASIVLSGGLTWDHVLFNVAGGSDITLDKGSQVNGILLAVNRKIRLKDTAQVIGGIVSNKVEMLNNSKVTRPPLVSPF